MKLNITVKGDSAWDAYWIAKQFVEEYPEGCVGVYQCVVYGVDGRPNYACYRTKTGTIVVREC